MVHALSIAALRLCIAGESQKDKGSLVNQLLVVLICALQEKIIKLNGTSSANFSIDDCRLRVSVLCGKDTLHHIPKELHVRTRTELGAVVAYLSGQERTVLELEPDGEADTDAYLAVSTSASECICGNVFGV